MKLKHTPPHDAKQRYLKDKRSHVADKTIYNYDTALSRFLEFLNQRGIEDMRDVDSDEIVKFEQWRLKNVKPITCRNDIRTVKNFIEFCETIQASPVGLHELIRPTKVSEEDEIIVDSDGNLIDGKLMLWERDNTSIDVSNTEAQQYLETDIDSEPLRAYQEAVNRAWYTQVLANSRDMNEYGHHSDRAENFSISNDGYSSLTAQETAAEFHSMMNTEVDSPDSPDYTASRIPQVAAHHPYLVATWLNLFEPSPTAREQLTSRGVDI